ncbi:MAG: PCRF domain-containing protein [Candidatus Yonathbacteria bacterium]|nr:PCRF domain-containing protein [Candidatus Yonathbacteria bacterium]NTW47442.1 PCRF domain-containing protein [Candidatus Yonathbacteria bacterium]
MDGMPATKEEREMRIAEIDAAMMQADFWSDKDRAQAMIRELQALKDALEGLSKYDKRGAVISFVAGAGGDDAEDFARMLVDMYVRFAENRGWTLTILHRNDNDNGGIRNLTAEIDTKHAYGTLKNESGVHRLVRMSPFNAKGLRHTSFALVEVTPKVEKEDAIDIRPEDLSIEFARSSGPGGQNVNKRETAVRIVHIPTNIAVHVETERSQERNRDKAMEVLEGKLFKKQEEDRKRELAGLSPNKTMQIEWGNQIRSYVLHPYKMIKDHRTGVEVRDTDKVLGDGVLDEFLDAEKDL